MLYGELPTLKTKDGQDIHGFPIRILNPPKTALLRFPTDEEILKRLSKQVTISQAEGRGKSSSRELPARQADLELFRAIRIDKDGQEFDEFEAARAIAKINYCRVVYCELSGAEFEVKLDTYAGEVTHTLHAPTEEQVWKYQEGIVVSRNLGNGKTELKYRHQVAVDLFEALQKKPSDTADTGSGYLDDFKVPASHKFIAILAMADAYDQIDEPVSPNS